MPKEQKLKRHQAVAFVAFVFVLSIECSVSAQNTGVPRYAFEDDKSGLYGFISRDGEVIIKPHYKQAWSYSDGIAKVMIDDQLSYIDAKNRLLFKLPKNVDRTRRSERRIWFQVDMKSGLCDDQGNVLLKPTFDEVEAFSQGLAKVNLGGRWELPGHFITGGKWGFVDTSGKVAIPVKYEDATSFRKGLARIEQEGETFHIDRTGKVVAKTDGYSEFSEGLCALRKYDEVTKAHRTQYVNMSGQVVVEIEGYGEEFHGGLAKVSQKVAHDANPDDPFAASRHYGFVDTTGQWVISPKFVDARDFSEGLTAVCIRKPSAPNQAKWGFINKEGKMVIWPQFNDAGSFDEERAMVHVGGTFTGPHDAPGWWEGGSWILIDATGNKIAKLWNN